MPLNTDRLDALRAALPPGWAFLDDPFQVEHMIALTPEASIVVATVPDELSERYAELHAFLNEHELRAEYRSPSYNYARGYLAGSFILHDADDVPEVAVVMDFGPAPCPFCARETAPGHFRCPECSARLRCYRCSVSATPLRIEEDHGHVVCYACSHECCGDECDAILTHDEEFCEDCGERFYCLRCEVRLRSDEEIDNEECHNCSHYRCVNCGEPCADDHMYDDYDDIWCNSCYYDDERTSAGPSNDDEFDDVDEDDDTERLVPAIPGRESIRSCGVELEYGGNGRALAQALFNEGLSPYDHLLGYHSSSRTHASGQGGFVLAEQDGSVDVELVTRPINPADSADMELLSRTLAVVRRLVKEGSIKLDTRCGNHIHVGAKGMAYRHAANLNKRFGWMEDMLYRLAAAKWSNGHRGTTYTRPVMKNCRSIAELQGDRYFGLSFQNYFGRINNCTCGAVLYDAMENCTCDLGKCTVEFRIFNTTANPIKVHAHLAICQALVADAIQGPNLFDEDLPPQEYNGRHFDRLTPAQQETLVEDWKPRIKWMLTELPLTNDERKSLLYCINNSELHHVGGDFLAECVPNPEQTALAV